MTAEPSHSRGEIRTREARRRILVVAARAPWVQRRGDQLRAMQFCRALGQSHEVDLLVPEARDRRTTAVIDSSDLAGAVSGRIFSYRRSAADRLVGLVRAALVGDPWQGGLYASRDLERRVAAMTSDYDLVVVQMVRLLNVLRRVTPERCYVDLIDSLSLGFSRRAELERGMAGHLLAAEARRLAAGERAVLAGGVACSVVCARDRDHLLELEPAGSVDVLPLAVAPETPFSEDGEGDESSRETIDLVFTGNLGYWVNRDALKWFLDRVWPQLRLRFARGSARRNARTTQSTGALRFVVAGDRPPTALVDRLRAEGIECLQRPSSLRAVVRSARVAIAPMRGGSGVPVKVLEAMAEGVPVIASEWAVAGVRTPSGVEAPVLVCDDPQHWVDAVERLLGDENWRRQHIAAGRAFVDRHHSHDACDQLLSSTLHRFLGPRRNRR